MSIEIRPYQWGDREALDGQTLVPVFVPDAVTILLDGSPVATGGIIPYAPGTFEAWAVVKKEQAGPSVWKAMRDSFDSWKKLPRVKRLFCFVDPGNPAAIRTAKRLGMQWEARLPAWWNGEERALYGWVK